MDWPDLAKIFILRVSLNEALKKKLEVQLILLITYDNFIRALYQLSGYSKLTTFIPATGQYYSYSDKMDFSNILIVN